MQYRLGRCSAARLPPPRITLARRYTLTDPQVSAVGVEVRRRPSPWSRHQTTPLPLSCSPSSPAAAVLVRMPAPASMERSLSMRPVRDYCLVAPRRTSVDVAGSCGIATQTPCSLSCSIYCREPREMRVQRLGRPRADAGKPPLPPPRRRPHDAAQAHRRSSWCIAALPVIAAAAASCSTASTQQRAHTSSLLQTVNVMPRHTRASLLRQAAVVQKIQVREAEGERGGFM